MLKFHGTEEAERAKMSTFLHLQTSTLSPEAANLVRRAYEQALHTLCVRDRDDPLTQLIAKTIIKVAQTGIADPAAISAQAISELEIR